jgi:hypothetical protein
MDIHREDDIRVRAYHLWEADGRPDGRDLEFWEQARQSLSKASPQAAGPAPKTTQRSARRVTPARRKGSARKG